MPLAQINENFAMNYEVHPGLASRNCLLIHGNLACNSWWHPLLEKSEKSSESKSILAEWRGCGGSSTPSSVEELHPKNLAADYIALLDELGENEPVNLIGHSAGGLISLYLMLEYPERFNKAVLIAPVPATGLFVAEDRWEAFAQMPKDRGLLEVALAVAINPPDRESTYFQSLIDIAFKMAPPNWHGVLKAFSSVDIVDRLSEIKHDILILHGTNDLIIPIEGSKEMSEKLPNAKFISMEKMRHTPLIESTEQVVKHLTDFL